MLIFDGSVSLFESVHCSTVNRIDFQNSQFVELEFIVELEL